MNVKRGELKIELKIKTIQVTGLGSGLCLNLEGRYVGNVSCQRDYFHPRRTVPFLRSNLLSSLLSRFIPEVFFLVNSGPMHMKNQQIEQPWRRQSMRKGHLPNSLERKKDNQASLSISPSLLPLSFRLFCRSYVERESGPAPGPAWELGIDSTALKVRLPPGISPFIC